MSETGKTFEDASLCRDLLRRRRVWLLGRPRRRVPRRRPAVKSSQLLVKGKKLILRYRPLGLIGSDRPVELPLDELLRAMHPCGFRGR